MRVAILVSGRGSNMTSILEKKKAGGLPNAEIVIVISNKKDAPALSKACEYNIKTSFVDPAPYKRNREAYDSEVLKVLKREKVDFIVLAGFMRIISPVLIDAYPSAIINIHPALLPSFPGLHSQKQALDYGVKVTGCTVHFVEKGMDTGPVIMQAVVPVLSDDNENSLSERILEYEHRLLPKALDFASRGRLRVSGRRVYVGDEFPDIEYHVLDKEK
jgi:phosphoribosylglycinamide formyltransferase 1